MAFPIVIDDYPMDLRDKVNFQEMSKDQLFRKQNWLTTGIKVKLGNGVNQIGDVLNVNGPSASVRFPSGNLEVHHYKNLTTVVLGIGSQLKVVNSSYEGALAILEDIFVESGRVTILVTTGPFKGRRLSIIKEDVSALADNVQG